MADPEVMARFVAAMDDDLDTPAATAVLFDTVRRCNAALDAHDRPRAGALAMAAADIADALGLELREQDGADTPDEVAALVAAREVAREAKDFARADELRDAIAAAGWTVEDTPEGARLTRT